MAGGILLHTLHVYITRQTIYVTRITKTAVSLACACACVMQYANKLLYLQDKKLALGATDVHAGQIVFSPRLNNSILVLINVVSYTSLAAGYFHILYCIVPMTTQLMLCLLLQLLVDDNLITSQ